MVNFDCLKNIEYEATTKVERAYRREGSTFLTDDMIDVLDVIREKRKTMSVNYPSFSSDYFIYFSYDNELYQVLEISHDYYIMKDAFIHEDDDDYTFEEFLEDYYPYYYLDLNTMTVKSLYNHKEYIIEEKE